MTGMEAIQHASALFVQLVDRVKDRQTATLVGQLQSFFQTIQKDFLQSQADLINASKRELRLEREHSEAMKQLEASHLEAVTRLNAKLEQFNGSHAAQVSALQQQIQQLQAQNQKPAVDEWPEAAQNMLLALFKAGGFVGEGYLATASRLNDRGMARYHLDRLVNRELIHRSAVRMPGHDLDYHIDLSSFLRTAEVG